MASLAELLRNEPSGFATARPLAPRGRPLFGAALNPLLTDPAGQVLVWAVSDRFSTATITDQFKAEAAEYHRRYAAADHFEGLFRLALETAEVRLPAEPLVLDLGSGSGANSVVPCRRIFPGAWTVATDLSGELLAILADYVRQGPRPERVICVRMDAMSRKLTPGVFDLVTGASILHHLDEPNLGIARAGRALKPGGHAIFFEPFIGWSILRLAFERILAEAALRKAPLEPVLDRALRLFIADVEVRSRLMRKGIDLSTLDDKWLFSRRYIERAAEAAGFVDVRFVPLNDHPSLYRDTAAVHLRLNTGREDLALPAWAIDILDSYDAGLNFEAKRELMLEAAIVLTKGRGREPRGGAAEDGS
jgi:SAM-dependent methyltransferase